jgi:hypothetical protein
MQRSICRFLGACGLVFTFTAAAQTAGGGAAAGGAAGGGAAAGGTIGASGGGRVGTSGATATAAPSSGRTTAPGTAIQGQNVSTIPGQSVSVTPPTVGAAGQPSPSAPASSGTTITAPNTANASTTPGLTGTTTATPGAAVAGATVTGGRQVVSFNSLSPAVQSQIAAQLPQGAQLGGIIAETTPQGTTTYRAQVMQNGVVSEMALGNVANLGTATTTATGVLPTSGFVVGTPYTFGQLPPAVQTAFAAQGAAGMTNVAWMPAGNGGVFRAMVDGRMVDVRVGPNGQILPNPAAARAVAATSTTSTNNLTLDDLPVAVRDAVRNSAPFAEVTRVRKSSTASGDVYDITMRANDRLTMMQVSETGTVLKENHDLAAAIRTDTAAVRTNEPPKLAWNSLPNAIRDSIQVQTSPDAIKTLALTNYLGKTAYVVDYVDKDAIRNRLFINKEGLVVDTQTNLFGIAMTGKPVVIDDLPDPARAIVQQQAENSAVTRIDLAMYGLTPVYVVTYQRDGEARQMVVSRDGRRMDSAVGAPAVTTIGSEKARSEAETKATELKIDDNPAIKVETTSTSPDVKVETTSPDVKVETEVKTKPE